LSFKSQQRQPPLKSNTISMEVFDDYICELDLCHRDATLLQTIRFGEEAIPCGEIQPQQLHRSCHSQTLACLAAGRCLG